MAGKTLAMSLLPRGKSFIAMPTQPTQGKLSDDPSHEVVSTVGAALLALPLGTVAAAFHAQQQLRSKSSQYSEPNR
jgi:hypothetical protein